MSRTDLNASMILDDGCRPSIPLESFNGTFVGAELCVYFKDLESALVSLINEHADKHGSAAAIVGCVAWLTSAPIMAALRNVRCSIIVQKEDLWRPDVGHRNEWSKTKIRAQYNALNDGGTTNLDRSAFSGRAWTLNTHGETSIDAIRCVGNLNSSKSPAFPRSHHKFIVFGHMGHEGDGLKPYEEVWTPETVWTGSFNFTHNAALSFENAILINHYDVARTYTHEWAQILALSESLNYASEWIAPDYRVGT